MALKPSRRDIGLGLLALATGAMAQMGPGPSGSMRGGPPGGCPVLGGGSGGGSRSLEDMTPPDFIAQLHRTLVERRADMQLQASQAPRYDRMLSDLNELARHNERRFWRVVGRGDTAASASPDLQRRLAGDLREEEERAQAVRDLMDSTAQATSMLNAAQQSRWTAALAEVRNALSTMSSERPMRRP